MTKFIFAMAVAALMTVAVSGTSQAAPIAPLTSGVSAPDSGQVTKVWWHRRCGWHHGRRVCW